VTEMTRIKRYFQGLVWLCLVCIQILYESCWGADLKLGDNPYRLFRQNNKSLGPYKVLKVNSNEYRYNEAETVITEHCKSNAIV